MPEQTVGLIRTAKSESEPARFSKLLLSEVIIRSSDRMTRSASLMLGFLLGMFPVFAGGAHSVPNSNVRAVNSARMKAESLNGGLSRYRAAKCMYATGQGGGACLKSTTGGYLFLFGGGSPGWQENGQPASVETEILVSPDGSSDIEVIYNGSPR